MSIAVALGACNGGKRAATRDSLDPAGGGEPATRRIIGYFTAWSVYDRDYHVADIPADKLTHVNYGFANISAAGECELGDPHADVENEYLSERWEPGSFHGSFNQLVQLKKRAPGLRTSISVGGWDWSGRFSDVALTAEARQRFASSCVAFVQQYGFDGIDIVWEFPVGGGQETHTTRPQDKQNLTMLLAELRAQLDALGAGNRKQYSLSIAAPAIPGLYINFELAAIGEIVDWINLMTYDFHGDWSDMTNFNAALHASSTDPTGDEEVRASYNAHAVVQAYLAAGVPAGKIVVGVPFYGRGYQGVPGIDNGLYQPHEGEAMGTSDPGIFDYGDIVQSYLPVYQRFWHDESMVPWLYNPVTGIMISYEDPESLAAKAAYINEHGLGGAMIWELSNDSPDAALLSALHEGLSL